ncbi:MAG: transposase family protein [Candidatus Competibacteraceae bacterium]|nr:transposase family protein [Candidatus Competibacteraceae bacterium]
MDYLQVREFKAIVEREGVPMLQGVLSTLECLCLVNGRPENIRNDNGPEFIVQAVQNWIAEKDAKTRHIKPGSPWQNAYIERFNDKFCDQCLNMENSKNGDEAHKVIEARRHENNERRPHSSLYYQTLLSKIAF